MKFTIPGNPVTKKNSQRILRGKNGIPFIRPSEAFLAYQKQAGVFILQMAQTPPDGLKMPLRGRYNVKCVYYMQTRRKVDLTNLLEASCDMLVHYGVLEDDNSSIVISHDGSRVLYDKDNPRAEIEITEDKTL